MDIKPNQLDAALSLLGWNQSKLAESCGCQQAAISKMINGTQKIQDQVVKALIKHGIQFIQDGVTLKQHYSYVIEDNDWYLTLLDDVYDSLLDRPDAELLIFFGDDRKSPPEVFNRLKKMRNAGIAIRQIIEEGNDCIHGALPEYRQITSEYFTNAVSLVYGNKTAYCIDNNTRAMVHHDPAMAMAARNQFNAMFHMIGKQPERSTADERF